jgi:2-dehydropantoate 2-reductase
VRILVAGAGAVGGYFGALLLRAGREVTFLARSRHAAAMRKDGLAIDSYREGQFVVRPPIISSLAEAQGHFDLVIVAVKSNDLPALAQELTKLDFDVVCSLLNGVESEEQLAKVIGRERVVGAVAHVGAEITQPGHVKHTTRGEILVAPLRGNTPDTARAVAEILASANIPGGYHDDLGFITWRKLIWNNGFNAITALADCTMGHAAKHPALRELLRKTMSEAVAVATAEGVKLPDNIVETMIGFGESYGDARTSMHQDVLTGRPTEHEALNGVVCRLGRKHGIPTPVNDVLVALLSGRVK